jgi:putative transcription factor
MVQCEMCGTETASPNRVKIEGAELDVCDECTDFGTEVQTEESSTTSTKYSTGSSSSSSSSSSTSSGTTSSGGRSSSGGSGSSSSPDIYDDIEELAQDFDQRIRSARESAGLSQEDLAKELNEKASLIRKLEHGDTLPTDEVQRKLESRLDVDLSAGGSAEDTEWESESSGGEYTLGDMVERKDS